MDKGVYCVYLADALRDQRDPSVSVLLARGFSGTLKIFEVSILPLSNEKYFNTVRHRGIWFMDLCGMCDTS